MFKLVLAFLVGGLVMGGLFVMMMPGLMIKEKESPFSVEETVEKIKEKALAQGWVVPDVKYLHKSIEKHGGGEIRPVVLVELCNAHHAFKILNEDMNKKISVFMPCTISVYEKNNGKVFIGTMNASLMGRMFGGVVSEVMSVVSKEQRSFIKFK